MYPYGYTAKIEGEDYLSPSFEFNSDTGLSDQVVINPDPTTLVLSVTEEQYTDLLSAAIEGAQIAYPDNWMTVIAPLLIAGNMTICDSVANCIANSENVYNALSDFIERYNSYGNRTFQIENYTLSPSQRAENLLPAGYTCDDDHLMGMARFIVYQLHLTTIDVFEFLLAATQAIGSVNALNVKLPIVGSMSLAKTFLDSAQTLYTLYTTAYTQATEDALACSLYCQFKDVCEVSIDLLIAGYDTAIDDVNHPTTENLETFLQWLMDNAASLLGVNLAAAFQKLIIGFIQHDAEYGAVLGLRTLKTLIALGADEIDTSWNTCACNQVPQTEFGVDCTIHNASEYPQFTMINWTGYYPSQGWRPQWNAFQNNRFGMRFDYTFEAPVNLQSIEIWRTAQTIGSIGGDVYYLYDSNDVLLRTQTTTVNSLASYKIWTPNGNWSNVKRIQIRWTIPSGGALVFMTQFRLTWVNP